MSDSSALDVKS